MENTEALKKNIIRIFTRMGDKKAVVIGNKSYSGIELANEVENETEIGIDMVNKLIRLTIDLLTRDKIKL